MKYFFTLALISAVCLPFVARADIAPNPGFHAYVVTSVIDNLADYPEYDVYLTMNGRFGASPRMAGGPDLIPTLIAKPDGHSSITGPWMAIEQDDQSKIIHKNDPDGELGDMWYLLPQNQSYFIKANVTGKPSDFSDELEDGGWLPDTNPVYAFVYTYHIDTLSNGTFATSLVSEARYDKKGKILSSVPVSAGQTTNLIEPNILGIETEVVVTGILVGIGILGLVLGVKAWKMK